MLQHHTTETMYKPHWQTLLMVKYDVGACNIISICQPESWNHIKIESSVTTITKTLILISFRVGETDKRGD